MNGTDFIPELLTAFRGKRVAFWGTQDPFLAQAALVAEREFGVRVVSLANGFMAHDNYLVLAKETYPDLIVLGMGMPKQEQLARLLREKGGGAPLIACGGAVLDFLGGTSQAREELLNVQEFSGQLVDVVVRPLQLITELLEKQTLALVESLDKQHVKPS